ncbi:hypothetical protein [Synechococcus sp. A15-60]|uniref:hypothetical protein n=1 Tax=Synechococcus sp. A15-60 TaxID=1050655 RepID=UPI00164594B9|nr:hypothetical protein [Synechococcus sp. A15-60]
MNRSIKKQVITDLLFLWDFLGSSRKQGGDSDHTNKNPKKQKTHFGHLGFMVIDTFLDCLLQVGAKLINGFRLFGIAGDLTRHRFADKGQMVSRLGAMEEPVRRAS